MKRTQGVMNIVSGIGILLLFGLLVDAIGITFLKNVVWAEWRELFGTWVMVVILHMPLILILAIPLIIAFFYRNPEEWKAKWFTFRGFQVAILFGIFHAAGVVAYRNIFENYSSFKIVGICGIAIYVACYLITLQPVLKRR